jgi:exodeoxyribonuclease V alpha subunit
MAVELSDPFDSALALGAPALLREFNAAGILDAADVHVARTLGVLAAVDDERLLLAAALAVRAPRMGHVFVDLETVADAVALEDPERPQVAWPPAAEWLAAVARCSQLVAIGPESQLPLRLERSHLYLDRYWREERELADSLTRLADRPPRPVDLGELGGRLARLFPRPGDELQRIAVACAVLRNLTVIAGGPGTGKTTTVARLVALLCEQALAAGAPAPLIALCAPTGKAATRLGEALQEAAGQLPIEQPTANAVRAVGAGTIHRLLGWRPGGRFRHTAANRLPHDLVIVDETSMVPLSLMTRLVAAIRSDAQLVLVGDPDQLTAIEAGAVLRDIVGPAATGTRFSPAIRSLLDRVVGPRAESSAKTGGDRDGAAAGIDNSHHPVRSFGDGVVVLQRGHRFGESIGSLAEAIRRGDGDAVVAAAAAGAATAGARVAPGPGGAADTPAISWIVADPDQPIDDAELTIVRTEAVSAYGAVRACARAGDGTGALAALGSFRLLCAHRRGPHGVTHWTARIERWLHDELGAAGEVPSRTAVGQPLLITRNDHELRLNNGDTGVIVEGLGAVFERDGALVGFAPSRLADIEPLYAMTVHKSQGSQFDTAAVVLPGPDAPILTRELLYTAVTRARQRLILIASEAALRAAVQRPVARATGLRELLWQ